MPDPIAWQPDPTLTAWLRSHRQNALDAYKANPLLVGEHGRQEDSFRTGGYADRQVLELVQNAADAQQRSGTRGRVELRLTSDGLYCANQGEPFTQLGLEAVCHAYLSAKRGDEIGRFGLGFKSVLGVTDRPAVFSRSVSFGFDQQASSEELAYIAPDAGQYPVLRLPSALDVDREFAEDKVLRELSKWATTVVRLPLTGVPKRLFQDLQSFHSEFLLFAPSIESLTITLSGDKSSQTVTHFCQEDGDYLTLIGEEGQRSRWLVFHRRHRLSADAQAEVGEALRRDEVKVSYAAPMVEADVARLGSFWAYFPLQDVTSTRGIHNAPWRINDDRTNLLPGVFNEELLDVIADLVVEAIPRLTNSEDPARHFDYLPARGREAPNEADAYLASTIPGKARCTACVPDVNGVLRRPESLLYPHSDLRLEMEDFRRWSAVPESPADAPHWSCYSTGTRKARLRALLRADDGKAASCETNAASWLQRLVSAGSDDQIIGTLSVLDGVQDPTTRQDLLAAKVLPDTSGNWHRLDATRDLFLRGNVLSGEAGLQLLRSSLLEVASVEASLRKLGFDDVDPAHELRKLATTAARKWTGNQWKGFWSLVEDVNVSDAKQILTRHLSTGAPLKVLSQASTWVEVGTLVVPGIVEPINPALALDIDYHASHLSTLAGLGVTPRPEVTEQVRQDLTFREYLRLQREAYLKGMPPRGRPDAASLHFVEGSGPSPLYVLQRFADTKDTAAQVIWTRELLDSDQPATWTLAHANRNQFPQMQVQAPHLWAAHTMGLLTTGWGARPPAQTLKADLRQYSPLLPVADLETSAKLRLIDGLDEVSLNLWREFLGRPPIGDDPWKLGDLLVEAASRMPPAEKPPRLPALDGRVNCVVPPADLLLARTEEECRALSERGLPHVGMRSDDNAALLTERWGCVSAADQLRVEIVADAAGEAITLLDRFRGLRAVSAGRLDGVELVECSELERQVTTPDGLESKATDLARSGNTVFYLNSMAEEELLARLSDEFELELTATAIEQVRRDAATVELKAKVAACRAESDLGRKLLTLLPVGTLEATLPQGLLTTLRRLSVDEGPTQVAELFLHVHGYNVLVELKHALAATGYAVPQTWAGSPPAIAFVRSLGFASEYAGTRGGSLAADITVLGPPRLDELHPYQLELADMIRSLVKTSDDPQRALLFLPTGAGKTRVTVEALVRAFIDDGFRGPLLWIAQSEELCEQAVQTWSTVWREFGNQPLRICRLWSSNEVAQSDGVLSVVIATDAKLDVVRVREDYDWLNDAAAVVIDEAHTATGAGMDQTLRWLGLDAKRTARPLLGLTATPFKGRDPEANRRLATRFGKNKMDVLGDDPYGSLQAIGVLARVEQRRLAGGSVRLDAGEARSIETFGKLPPAVLERLGRDEERTKRLLDDITGLPEDWQVLVFTASVLSSQILAALLRVHGVKAASVSGATPIAERRRTIAAFGSRDVRVLTNCNVLTQGFDAPAVRALYVARPTFSPNAYIQMVGRGLRGPANGGTEECLVVNVADTLDQFGENLAYKEFDYLWDQQGGAVR